MKRIILFVALFFSLSSAAGTYATVPFTTDEELASNYMIAYYPYQSFVDLGLSATSVNTYIMPCRYSYTPTLSCVLSKGLSSFQFNFLMALMGGLIGFAFAFFLIYGILNIGKKA